LAPALTRGGVEPAYVGGLAPAHVDRSEPVAEIDGVEVDVFLAADVADLLKVEGVGETRAGQLRAYFDRLLDSADEWEPVLD